MFAFYPTVTPVLRYSLTAGVIALCSFSQQAFAAPAGTCGWFESSSNRFVNGIVKEVVSDFGTVYVPRDARNGSVLGSPELTATYNDKASYRLGCTNWGAFSMKGLTKQITGVTVPKGYGPAGTVYGTNVPGIGVIFKFAGSFSTQVDPSDNFPFFPGGARLTGIFNPETWTSGLPPFTATIVKTGEIAMGNQKFEAKGTVWGDSYGSILEITVKGSVIRSECTVPASSKTIEVAMGDVNRRDFKGKDSFLESHEFEIPLVDCIAGSYPDGQGWNYFQEPRAHMRLEGVKGSSIISMTNGIVGLTSDSDATGVAVQILDKTGATPVVLGIKNRLEKLQDGDMSLKMNARYIQTSDDPNGPGPGKANASLNFTLTYE